MPRFYFDMYDGSAIPDRVGTELASRQEAQRRASLMMADLFHGDPDRVWRDKNWTVWVRDEAGSKLFSVQVVGITVRSSRE